MAAGLTDHVWSRKDVLLFRGPPWPQPQARSKVGQEDGRAKERDGSVYKRARRCERGAENALRGLTTGCWAPLRRLTRGPMELSAASRYATPTVRHHAGA